MAAKPLTAARFQHFLDTLTPCLADAKSVAVGVSGGPDSMALAYMLGQWAKKHKIQVHAITVDHGLRAESAKEARLVHATLKDWPNTKHAVLRWKGRKPKARLMEAARAARYALMAGYCRDHKIKHLFLAHQQDDQAETFLFRLAKGSGLDGLSSIRPVQPYDSHLLLLRPLLNMPKQTLEATCKSHGIAYIKDPSNDSERFARPRLRKARAALEGEGLTSKRLAVTASRLERARAALEEIAKKTFENNAIMVSAKRIVLSNDFLAEPADIAFRVLLQAVTHLRPGAAYHPRMEKAEHLFADLAARAQPFRKRTLGGLVFARDDKKHTVTIATEKA